jgi:hypothetical protein
MTFTLSKLSGKAIRLISRYLAMVQLGGKLGQSPDVFYEAYCVRTGESAVEAERKFGNLTDEFENRVRDEEGFLGDHYDVVEYVRGRLGEGFLREGEAEADHRRPAALPVAEPKAAGAAMPAGKSDVARLLKQLKSCTDKSERQKLRRQLRRLGHRGGAR